MRTYIRWTPERLAILQSVINAAYDRGVPRRGRWGQITADLIAHPEWPGPADIKPGTARGRAYLEGMVDLRRGRWRADNVSPARYTRWTPEILSALQSAIDDLSDRPDTRSESWWSDVADRIGVSVDSARSQAYRRGLVLPLSSRRVWTETDDEILRELAWDTDATWSEITARLVADPAWSGGTVSEAAVSDHAVVLYRRARRANRGPVSVS